jgi:hypothetical protein
MTSLTWRRAAASRFAWVVLLLVVGAYFRIAAVSGTTVDGPLRADALDYFLSAYNLVHYGVYSRSRAILESPSGPAPQPDAYRSPGVPMIFVPFISVLPNGARMIRRVQSVNVLFGLATIVAITLAAATALPWRAAAGVGLLTACSPHLVSLTVYTLSETPGAFFVAALLAVAAVGVPARPELRTGYFVSLGVLIGALALFRPAFIAFAPVMALAFPERADKWRALLLGCLGTGLITAPWAIRNAVNLPRGDAPSLFATGILEGSYRGFIFNGDTATFPYGARSDPKFQRLRVDSLAAVREAGTKFAANPGDSLRWYVFEKPVYLFQWSNIDGVGDVFVYPATATPFKSNPIFKAVHETYRFAHPLVLLLAVIGAVLPWPRRFAVVVPNAKLHVPRIASLLLAYLYLVHLPFATNVRYALPVFPAIYLLVAFSVAFPWLMRSAPVSAPAPSG